jgi:diaminopimelate epimerase
LRGAAEEIDVLLPGGRLSVEWDGSLERERPVFMTGPAQRSFEGSVDIEVAA